MLAINDELNIFRYIAIVYFKVHYNFNTDYTCKYMFIIHVNTCLLYMFIGLLKR